MTSRAVRGTLAGFIAAALTVGTFLLGMADAGTVGGDLDRGFGGDGLVKRNLARWDSAESIAVRRDRSFVTASQVRAEGSWRTAVFSFRPNGRIDRSFGDRGRVFIPRAGDEYSPTVALDERGRPVVAFGTDTNGATVGVARLTRRGALDQSFDRNGVQTVGYEPGQDSSSLDFYTAEDIAISPDGGILVTGFMRNEQSGGNFGVVKLRLDGRLDGTFGTAGRVSIDVDQGSDAASSIAIDDAGRIVLAGRSAVDRQTGLAVARLMGDGALDPTFAGDGAARYPQYPGAADLAIRADGSIVTTGSAGGDFAVSALTESGSPESGFGDEGSSLIDFADAKDVAAALLDTGDRLFVVGTAVAGTGGRDLAVASLRADGSLDTGFADDGRAQVDFGAADGGQSLALSGRRLLAGGYVRVAEVGAPDSYDTTLAGFRIGRG